MMKIYSIYSIDPAPWGERYRLVESFDTKKDAECVIKVLWDVNVLHNCYEIIEEERIFSNEKQLRAEIEKLQWIPVGDRLPELIKDTNQSRKILILDDGAVHVGDFYEGKFEYWLGSFCNTDHPNSQKNITHWMLIILPEKKGMSNK